MIITKSGECRGLGYIDNINVIVDPNTGYGKMEFFRTFPIFKHNGTIKFKTASITEAKIEEKVKKWSLGHGISFCKNQNPVRYRDKQEDSMRFEKKDYLLIDQNPNGHYEQELRENETLLVGENPVLSWVSDSNECGCNENNLFPAFHNGQKAWLKSWIWHAATGYCGTGQGEEVLNFHEGVNILLLHDAYKHMFIK